MSQTAEQMHRGLAGAFPAFALLFNDLIDLIPEGSNCKFANSRRLSQELAMLEGGKIIHRLTIPEFAPTVAIINAARRPDFDPPHDS